MRLIDSNVIAYAFYSNDKAEICQNVLREGGAVDTYNLIEAFFIIENETSREMAIDAIKTIYKLNIQIIDVDMNLIFESLRTAKDHNLKIYDLIHYTAAKLYGCKTIISYDKHFDEVDIKREEPQ
jgi:predicted nucleic acid-binding protein